MTPEAESAALGRRLDDRLGPVSNEQILMAIVRVEAMATANAAAQQASAAHLNQRLEDKFGALQDHLRRQDNRLTSIEAKVGIAHDNALKALNSATKAGAVSGGSASMLIAGLMELVKLVLKP